MALTAGNLEKNIPIVARRRLSVETRNWGLPPMSARGFMRESYDLSA